MADMELNNLLLLNIVNSGISLIIGFYLIIGKQRSTKLGTRYWAFGSLVIGIGMFIKTFSPALSAFTVAVFPNFITVGLYLFLAGIWKFKDRKFNKWIVIGLPILDAAQAFIFFKLFPWYQMQIGLHMVFIIIFCLFAIYEMLRLDESHQYLKKIFYINSISFIIFLVLISLLLFAIIRAPLLTPSKTNITVLIIHLSSSFGMIALSFGFLSAINTRLNMELEGQLKSKTKFLTIIAHDLRGPVGNIINFLGLLQNETDLDEKERKNYLKILNTISQSTFHLLQNLLEWATKSENLNKFESERIELSELISGNINFFKSSATLKSINLEFNAGKNMYISGNPNMLETIVRNLVSNAIKYTPRGGSVIITLEKVLKNIRLIVTDTGRGIKPEIINSLFNFEISKSTIGTSGEVGSGLGLVLCKELVTSNNGEIEIKSQVGVGTTVIVEFPSII